MAKNMLDNFVVCKDKRPDCFSLFYGRCKILTDTEFGNRKCPFYKMDIRDNNAKSSVSKN